ETNVRTNLFAVSVASREEVMIAGDQGRILATKDGGLNWETQPTATSSPLYGVAYRGGSEAWVAGRGGSILRRVESLATVKIPLPKLSSSDLRSTPKLKAPENGNQLNLDSDDIPRAIPPIRKPQKP